MTGRGLLRGQGVREALRAPTATGLLPQYLTEVKTEAVRKGDPEKARHPATPARPKSWEPGGRVRPGGRATARLKAVPSPSTALAAKSVPKP